METALGAGGFDEVRAFSPQDLAPDFVSTTSVLTEARGGGYWLWKPYIIQQALESLSEDDFLFYCDAGAFFISPIDPYVKIMNRTGQDLIPFCLSYLEKHWTKRDAFILMDCDTPAYSDTQQRVGGMHLWRRSAFTLRFVAKWLHYAQDRRIITDIPNECGQPNYPGFIENRHDQSIFSLLTKKYNLTAYKPPYSDRPTPSRHIRAWETYPIDSHKHPSRILVLTRHRGPLPLKILRSYGLAPHGIMASCRYHIVYWCNLLWTSFRPLVWKTIARIAILRFLYRTYRKLRSLYRGYQN